MQTQGIVSLNMSRSIRIEIPAQLEFEHFRVFREAIDARDAIDGVIFDFRRAMDVPTWLMGFMLHVEERHGLDVRAENVSDRVRQLMMLAGLERLIPAHATAQTGTRVV